MINKKIVIHFTALTFTIMLIFWGGLVLCGQFGITLEKYPVLYSPQFIGAWSPAIASFIVLKRNNKVSGMKEWLRNIFTVKTSVYNYLFVIALFVVLMVSLIVTSGLNRAEPLYMFFVWMLGSLLYGAGMEEAGWRYILYSELNKKFGYILSCLITAPIWLLWHVPLWLSLENSSLGVRSFFSAIILFGGTFALGAIHKISKGNIFLCLLFHCAVNAGPSTFIPNQTILGVTITSAIMIVVSIAAVSIYDKLTSASPVP
ncbi:MAG: CPBP family intramembrane metalloprotease [Oscillospiraceae bacterium]|nr:CPBP family intramembrane metalloprotease [Oscillospiraceae bacterium]